VNDQARDIFVDCYIDTVDDECVVTHIDNPLHYTALLIIQRIIHHLN